MDIIESRARARKLTGFLFDQLRVFAHFPNPTRPAKPGNGASILTIPFSNGANARPIQADAPM
jgi:hypothetical protein